MNYSINLKGKILSFDKPRIMGVINVTNDSFYSGSRHIDSSELLNEVKQMISEGADIIDVGGYSSRPGAKDISEKEEEIRVCPAIEKIKNEFPDIIVSVDTFRSSVLKSAYKSGADICNDISGGNLDSKMFKLIAELQIPYILMHMKGNPQNMKELTDYDDMLLEMTGYFRDKIFELNEMGVYDIILDPGFGFAKTINQNFFLLKNLGAFDLFDLPLLVGISRKSMIYKSLNIDPEGSLNGTTALNTMALLQGAKILRVHDVREAKECVTLYEKYSSDRIY